MCIGMVQAVTHTSTAPSHESRKPDVPGPSHSKGLRRGKPTGIGRAQFPKIEPEPSHFTTGTDQAIRVRLHAVATVHGEVPHKRDGRSDVVDGHFKPRSGGRPYCGSAAVLSRS